MIMNYLKLSVVIKEAEKLMMMMIVLPVLLLPLVAMMISL